MESSSSQTPLVAEEALDVAPSTSLGADPTALGGGDSDANDDDQHNGWDNDGVDEDDLLLAIDEEEVGEEAQQAGDDSKEGKGGDEPESIPAPPLAEDAMITAERVPDVGVAPSTKADDGPSGRSSDGMQSFAEGSDSLSVRGEANVSGGADNKSSPELHRQPSSTVSSSTIENPAKLAAASSMAGGPDSLTPSPQLPQPPPVTVLSSSSSILERRVSVTSSRKHALLAEARDDRARWIRSVPLPYRQSIIEEGEANQNSWCQGTELARTHAIQSLPSALVLLRHLYQGGLGTNESTTDASEMPIPERIRDAIESAKSNGGCSSGSSAALVTDDADDFALSTTGGGNDVDDADHQSYLRTYRDVIRTLQDPSCAVLVQGMRNFCKKLMGLTSTDVKDVASKISSYLSGIMPSLSSNPVWNVPKQQQSSSSRTAPDSHHPHRRRALEAFLFGQCGSHLASLLWNDDAQRRESEWMDRMNDLQFVTPRHLEIACLSGNDENDKDLDVDELLKESVKVLLSVDAYYSPYDKLQRILALYRSVNAALSRALNSNSTATPGAATVKKLPSADDVLPTIILVVLRAKPRRLLHNLTFVEDGASPEALRGEAGYAYTNLYGAVQFLTDLDLNVDGSGSTSSSPDHLSMTADEFRQGLLQCREQAKERLNKPGSALAASALPDQDLEEEPEVVISPVEVRAARRQGVALDVEWALRFRQEQPSNLPPSTSFPQSGLPLSASVSDELVGVAADVLPLGFARSYNFLTTRPDDLRMSDLPQLLEEYRMLVHTTEGLLREKSTRIRSERKAQRKAAEHELYTRVGSVDPSLLVPHSSSASSLKTPGSARSRPSPRTTNGAK